MPTSYIFEKIVEAKEKFNIEGVTLIGGEPFLQPDGLKEIVDFCYNKDLTVICFTGYIYEKLLEEHQDILSKIDILIDGPFIMKLLDRKRRLIGSKNQRVHKLSEKYKNCDYFEQPHSEVEIQLYNNRLAINGDGVVFDDENGKFNFKIE